MLGTKTMQRVNSLGQITLDEDVRRQLKVEPGMVAHQRVVGDRLEVVFLPAPHSRSLFGVFHNPANEARVTTSDERDEAIAAMIAAEWEWTRETKCGGDGAD
jgi:hypothetical protein